MSTNLTDLYTLGARRFGSERWANMAIKLAAELQKQGIDPVPPELIANVAWIACVEAWGASTAHAVDKHCTRKVVGCIIWKGNDLLLQDRLTGAEGLAPSAGHREEGEGVEEAVAREVLEETGLILTGSTLLAEGRRFEHCKRYGSDYHDWSVLEGKVEQYELVLNPFESRNIGWYQPYEVIEAAARTEEYLKQQISEADWQQRPGLEVVWYYWLLELGILDRLKKLV